MAGQHHLTDYVASGTANPLFPAGGFRAGTTGMDLIVRCSCGWFARGTEDEIVAAATEHGKQVHSMTASREQILAMAEPAI